MRYILLNVARLIVLLLIVVAIRALVGYAARAFGFTGGKSKSSRVTPTAHPGGELKKDPVCGTFVSTSASVKKDVGGEVLHFCSQGCRDKYQAS